MRQAEGNAPSIIAAVQCGTCQVRDARHQPKRAGSATPNDIHFHAIIFFVATKVGRAVQNVETKDTSHQTVMQFSTFEVRGVPDLDI